MRYILIAILIIIGLIGVLLLVLSLPPGENYIKNIVEKELTAALYQKVTIASLRTDLFWRIRLHDVNVLEDTTSANPKSILHIRNLAVDYRLWRLLFKEVSIKSARLDSVSVYLHRDQEHGYNLEVLDTLTKPTAAQAPAETTKSSFRIIVQSASIDTFSAVYVDEIDSLRGNIQNGNIVAKQAASPGNYSFDIGLETVDMTVKSLPFWMHKSAIQGQWQDTTIVIDSLKSNLMDMNLAVNGRYVRTTPATVRAAMDLSGNPDTILSAIKQVYNIPPLSTTGAMDIRAQVNGALPRPHIAMQADLPSFTVTDISVNGGFMRARLLEDSLYLDSLYLSAFDGGIYANAFAILDTAYRAHGAMSVQDIAISALPKPPSAQNVPIEGKIDGQLKFAGGGKNIDGWTARADISTNGLRYKSSSVPDFKLALAVDSGLADLNITQRFLTASSRLQITGEELSGGFSLDVSNLGFAGVFIGTSQLSGVVTADGTISGTTSNPEIAGNLFGYNIDYRNIPVDTLSAKFQYADRQVRIVDSGFSGRIDSITPGKAPLDIDSLSGALAYKGTLSGTIDSLTGRVDLVASNPAYDGYGLDHFDLTAAINGMQISIIKGDAIKGTTFLEIGGSYDIVSNKGDLDLNVYSVSSPPKLEKFEPLNIPSSALQPAGELSARYAFAGQEINLTARGQKLNINALSAMENMPFSVGGLLDFNLNFAGTTANPSADVNLMISNFDYGTPGSFEGKGAMLDSVDASISINSNILTVNYLHAFKAKQSLSATASTHLQKDAAGNYVFSAQTPIKGTLTARQIDLKIAQPFLPPQDSLQGYLTADLNWNGTVSSPHPMGRFMIQNSKAVVYAGAPPIEIPLLVGDLMDTTVTVRADSARVLKNYFAAVAKVTLAQKQGVNTDIEITFLDSSLIAIKGYVSARTLDLTARLTMQDIAIIGPFFTSVDSLSGSLNADLTITGSPKIPDFKGQLLAHDIVFHPIELRNVFRNTTANISFTQTDVTIDTLSTEVGGGRIFLSGTASHTAATINSLNLTLTADSTRFEMPDILTVSIPSADITYKGRKGAFLLAGDIYINRARLTYDFDFESLLPWARSVKRIKPEVPAILQETSMNIRVHGGDSLWVVNNVANIRMDAALTVVGTPTRPNFTGQVGIDEGYLIYLDRKFQVTEATIYSGDILVFNPEINFSSEATVTIYQGLQSSVYSITLGVTGRLDSLQITLLSDPPLSKPDIVSLLTLGATMGQLTGQAQGAPGGGAGNVLLERAGTLSSQLVTGLFSGGLESALGLKSISVEGNLFNPAGPGGAQLSATKMISPRVTVTYSTNIGHLNNNTVLLDYLLTNHISLLGETDQTGTSSVSIQYELKFK